LPWRITSRPSGARSLGIEALTIRGRLLSSRTSRSLPAGFACGERLVKAAARSGPFAKKATSSPPPGGTAPAPASTRAWVGPIAPKRSRGGAAGAGLCGAAEAGFARAASKARPRVGTEDFRKSRRSVSLIGWLRCLCQLQAAHRDRPLAEGDDPVGFHETQR